MKPNWNLTTLKIGLKAVKSHVHHWIRKKNYLFSIKRPYLVSRVQSHILNSPFLHGGSLLRSHFTLMMYHSLKPLLSGLQAQSIRADSCNSLVSKLECDPGKLLVTCSFKSQCLLQKPHICEPDIDASLISYPFAALVIWQYIVDKELSKNLKK